MIEYVTYQLGRGIVFGFLLWWFTGHITFSVVTSVILVGFSTLYSEVYKRVCRWFGGRFCEEVYHL